MPTMNRFCGECGSRLEGGEQFCGQCGSAVKSKIDPSGEDIGQRTEPGRSTVSDWLRGLWRTGKGAEPAGMKQAQKGLLLTNSALLSESGLDGRKLATSFIDARFRDQSTGWHLLDAADELGTDAGVDDYLQFIEEYCGLLVKDDSETVPLLIFGDHSVVPMALIEDKADSGNDGDVDSDLPYVLLESDGIWDKVLEKFEPRMDVGRIPVGSHFGADQLEAYLAACREVRAKGGGSSVFGLSAKCWEGASLSVHKSLIVEGMSPDLLLSPDVEVDTLEEHGDLSSNWLYFNVHGSDRDKHWFGQEGGDYPRACAPEFFRQTQGWNIVGVEACYGARFIGFDPEDSALLTALASKTVAFAGASRIAYGPPDPPNQLADLVIRDFLKSAMEGHTVGDAMNHGRAAMLAEDNWDSDILAKSIMEFNLFGDPLLRVGTYRKDIPRRPINKPYYAGSGIPRTESLGQMDGRFLGQIRTMTEANASRMRESLSALLSKRYPDMKSVVPDVSRIRIPPGSKSKGVTEVIKVHYKAPSFGRDRKEVVAYCDTGGVVKRVLESKNRSR